MFSRELTFFLGYTDEGDGTWAIKLKASDPRKASLGRFVRLSACSQRIQICYLPKVRELVRSIVARARELADVIEGAAAQIENP